MIKLLRILAAAYIWMGISVVSSQASSPQIVKNFLSEIVRVNEKHAQETDLAQFKSYAEKQAPRATVVMCSDSRVQSTAINETSQNDLFFIRNIGNQIETAAGSVEYGVRILKTPVLLIIGHSACGAVQAALKEFSNQSHPIQKELTSMEVKGAQNLEQGIIKNIHHQVEFALKEFNDLVQNQTLIIIGAVYDFRNDYGQGHGRLILVNLNGEQDPHKLQQNALLKELPSLVIYQPALSGD